MPPLALYYLATILEDNGIEVDIVDPSIISRSQYFDTNVEAKKFIGNLFDNKEYDAILFSATTGNWGVNPRRSAASPPARKNPPSLLSLYG